MEALLAELGPTSASERAEYEKLAAELAGLTVEGIRRRPASLRAAQDSLASQQLRLASTSSAGFVESALCVSEVRKSLAAVSAHMEGLETLLPELGDRVSSLIAHADAGIDQRAASLHLLEHM